MARRVDTDCLLSFFLDVAFCLIIGRGKNDKDFNYRCNGQLGSELRNLLDERGIAYDAFDSKQMNITDQAVVNEKISALKPEVIYHCAAYTAVDNAEDVAKDLNWQVKCKQSILIYLALLTSDLSY